MPLPTPLSFTDFENNFMENWAIVVNVPDIQSIPPSDPTWGFAQASAGASLYLQNLVYQLIAFSRGSTATGTDLDSWWAQFGFKRPQGGKATVGIQVVVTSPLTIPSGSIFQTQAITVAPASAPQVFQFATTQDWVFSSPGTYSITAQSISPITIANVTGFSIYNNIPSGSVTQMFSPQSGVSSVTNPGPPVFGSDNASDSQGKADFVDFISSLSEATLSALIAAVQDSSAGFIYGQTFNLLEFSTAPTICQPGQIVGSFIGPGTGQYPGSNPDNLSMDAALLALQTDCAFGIEPLTYYAPQYAISAISISYRYSRNALTAAGLSVTGLQNMMTAALQAMFPASGSSLGVGVYFSTIIEALRGISVVLPNATVTGIVTDVNASALTIVTGGGTFTSDQVQPGTPGTRDLLGYLSMATTIAPSYTSAADP